jgi:hypothetical protein
LARDIECATGDEKLMSQIERSSTHDILNAMAIIANQAEEVPLAGIAYQIAELIHDDELTLPADAAERLLHIGAALWRKSMALDEKT